MNAKLKHVAARPVFRWLAAIAVPVFVVMAVVCMFGLLDVNGKPDIFMTLDDGHLSRIEKSIRAALTEIEDELSFEFQKSLPNTLVVNYRTQSFMVHGQSKRGEYTEKAHETVGPGYRGFQLRLTLEEAGFINDAGVPQTSREPYWTTYLDTRLLKGTDVQVFCGLSFGRQVDQELLRQVRKVITDLGDAPYLKRKSVDTTGPAPDALPAGRESGFKPFNRLPSGWNLVQTKAFLTAEGFAFDEEPKVGNGFLQASKYIGPEDTYHYVRIEFKGGYSVHVLEFAEDS